MLKSETLDERLAQARQSVELLTPERATELLGGQDVVFVDVRENAERSDQGCLPGSVSAPRSMLEWYLSADAAEHVPELSGSALFIFYCGGGGRSLLAAQTARKFGLARVASIEGGFRAWRDSGGKVDKA